MIRTDFKKVRKVFRKLPKEMEKASGQTLRIAGNVIKREVARSVPNVSFERERSKNTNVVTFDSSDLKKKARTLLRGRGQNKYAVIGFENTKWSPDWSHWIEFGTMVRRTDQLKRPRSKEAQRMTEAGMGLKKKPFFRSAVKRATPKAVAKMEVLGKKIENIVGKIK